MVNVEKGVLVEWYVAHWTTDHFLNKVYLKILWFGSFSSLVMWLLMFTLVIVNGGQHWLALAFSGSLPLYFYECLCIVQFYLANKVSSSSSSSVLARHRPLASADPTVPTAPPMRLIPNPNPNPKTHPNPNPIFNPNPNPLFERKKRHRNIGQHRVIFTGYLLRDGDGFIRGP